jgi:uncharacterized protein (TIRG00374 family)
VNDASGTKELPRLARSIAPVAILAAVTYAALSAYGDVHEIGALLEDFHWPSLGIALALSTLNFVLRGFRFQYYLRELRVRVPLWEAMLVFLAGLVMTVTPGKMGEVFKSFLLKWTHDAPLKHTSAAIVAERFTDLIAMLLMTSVGALYLDGGLLLAGLLLALIVGLVVLSLWYDLGLFVIRIVARPKRIARFAPKLTEAYDALHRMLRPAPFVLGVLLALVAWATHVAALMVVLDAFPGGSITAPHAALVYCGSLIAGVIALVPGGIGVAEAGMAGLLRYVGGGSISAPLAATVTVLVRLVTLWWAVLVGGLSTVLHRRLTGWAEGAHSKLDAPPSRLE